MNRRRITRKTFTKKQSTALTIDLAQSHRDHRAFLWESWRIAQSNLRQFSGLKPLPLLCCPLGLCERPMNSISTASKPHKHLRTHKEGEIYHFIRLPSFSSISLIREKKMHHTRSTYHNEEGKKKAWD